MIVFLESGRLGNQIFQYSALKTLSADRERLVLIGFKELQETFDGLDAIFILNRSSLLFKIATKYRLRIETFIRNLPLIGLINEAYVNNNLQISRKTGAISTSYCVEAFFQTQTAFNKDVLKDIYLKEHLVNGAQETLSRLPNREKIFVHVRRGDYLTYPPEYPAVLPIEWYFSCIDKMREKFNNPYFIVVSDDNAYVNEMFGNTPDVNISNGSPSEDFALMCGCDGGILSASSFAWWAAYFARRSKKGTYFIAPEYWMGHRRKEWHPGNLEATFLNYESVGYSEQS